MFRQSKTSTKLYNGIIGGMFGFGEFNEYNKITPPFYTGRELFFANARSCINFLARKLKPAKIWVPSYLCEVILHSIQGFSVEFYGMNTHLQVSRDWLHCIKRGDIVIFIDYFGFPFDSSLSKAVKEQGGWVVEDASQALLSMHVGDNSDFVIFSPRKFLGVPEGGMLRNNTNLDFSDSRLIPPPAEWLLKSFFATVYRSEFDRSGGDRRWYQLFQEIEQESPIGDYGMNDLTRNVIEGCYDYSEIVKERIGNYEILDGHLNKMALFPALSDGVVPLGFPVLLKNRNGVRQKMFEKNIYPPIHWDVGEYVPKKFEHSHALAGRILTLICDQRYDAKDMEKIAEIVLEEEK